ncbi:MAG: hypothetical protein V4505_22325 [Pseudomonadota bacterium]
MRAAGAPGFFRRHWRGDYSLARSYWVHSLLIQWFAPLLGLLLVPWLSAHFPARYGSATVLGLTALGLGLSVWALRGTWASAGRHVARGGSRGWALTARVVMVLAALRIGSSLVVQAPALAEHAKVATGWQLGPEVSFTVRADHKSILLSGGINDGTAEGLARALDQAPPSVTTVVLQSSGGWVRQGRLIAEVIAARKLDTYVEGECSSACTLAFLAGRQRAGEPGARLGFHSFQTIGLSGWGTGSGTTAAARQAYAGAHLSPAFLARVVATPPKSMWYPTQAELLAEGVYTRRSAGGETAALATEHLSRGQLAAEFAKTPLFAALSAKYPKEFGAIVDQAYTQAQAAQTDREVIAAARAQMARTTARLLPLVDDDTLLAFNRLLADQARALQPQHPEACVALIFTQPNSTGVGYLLPPDLSAREAALTLEMVRTSDPHNASTLSREATTQVIRGVLGQLVPKHLRYFSSAQARSAEPVEACKAVIAYLNAMNAITPAKRAPSIRAIYAYQ